MLKRTKRILGTLAILVGCKAAVTIASETSPLELSDERRSELIEAPKHYLTEPASDLLDVSIELGKIVEVRAETTEPGLIQGWIEYRPIEVAKNRTYVPRIICVANSRFEEFTFCQDESIFKVLDPRVERPITIRGEVSNEEVARVLDYMERNPIYSSRGGDPGTPDRLFYLHGQLDCCISIHFWIDPRNSDFVRVKRSDL